MPYIPESILHRREENNTPLPEKEIGPNVERRLE